MNKIFTWSLTFILSLSIPISSVTHATSQNKVVEKQNVTAESELFVDEQTALQMTENFLKKRDLWTGSKLKVVSHLYDIDDSVLGYVIVAEKDGKELGNLMVAASYDRGPVFEYGDNPAITENILKKNSEGLKAYYFGPMQIMFAKDKEDMKIKFEERKKDSLRKLENQKLTHRKEYTKTKERKLKSMERDLEENKKYWDQILQEQRQVSTEATYVKVLDVSPVSQFISGVNHPNSACGPTAGTMITNYYKFRGYNVLSSYDYSGGHAALINHLYVEMSTNWYGTFSDEFASGLDKHLEHNTPGKWTMGIYPDAVGKFGVYKAHIDGNAPVAVLFDNFLTALFTDQEWHWVVGSGYDNTDYSMAILKDPGGAVTGYYERRIKWVDLDDDMQLVTSGYNW